MAAFETEVKSMARAGENYMLVGEGNPELEAAAADEVRRALPGSAARYEQLRDTIPGATTWPRFWWPFPPFAEHGEGAYLWDIDGNRFLDVNMAFGPLILGHRPPEIIKALEEQLARGVFFGAGCVAKDVLCQPPVWGSGWRLAVKRCALGPCGPPGG